MGEGRAFGIASGHAGPFVTVLTLKGSVENGAQEQLRERLAAPELASQRVVVDLTEAMLSDSSPLALLAEESRRFASAGGELVVVGDEAALPGVRRFSSLNEALEELLGEVVERAGWPTDS